MPDDLRTESTGETEAHVRGHVDGGGTTQWFVYWETATAYGSRGVGLNREEAESLARRIRSGEVQP